MQVMTEAKARKQMQWRQRLARFAENGLPVKEFCQAESISTASFYRWQKELGMAESIPPVPPGFIDAGALRAERKAGQPRDEPSGAAALDIRLELGHGLVLHIARR
jgi:hypothetical protein